MSRAHDIRVVMFGLGEGEFALPSQRFATF